VQCAWLDRNGGDRRRASVKSRIRMAVSTQRSGCELRTSHAVGSGCWQVAASCHRKLA
jgi:hypothetical protein